MHWLFSSTCVINIVGELKSSRFHLESKNPSWNVFHDLEEYFTAQRQDGAAKIKTNAILLEGGMHLCNLSATGVSRWTAC